VAKDAIRRGDVILAPALHAPTDRIDATVHVLASEAKPTGAWFPVRLHSHAAEVGARIVPLAGPLAAWCNWFSTAPFNTRPPSLVSAAALPRVHLSNPPPSRTRAR